MAVGGKFVTTNGTLAGIRAKRRPGSRAHATVGLRCGWLCRRAADPRRIDRQGGAKTLARSQAHGYDTEPCRRLARWCVGDQW